MTAMAYSDKEWMDAKKKCRLNELEIAMEKQLGLNLRVISEDSLYM
jgi:hypothetical protein